MRVYYDIEQRTEEWHRIKHAKIGGTLAKGLFVKSDTLLIDIASCLLEPFKLEVDKFISDEMMRGIELEPAARRVMEVFVGKPLLNCGWIQSTSDKLLGISPDGITVCETEQIELKCPGRKKHTEALFSKDILPDYIHQCLHAFTVNEKLQKLHFGSYRPESSHPMVYRLAIRDTPINLGTKAKPVIKPVAEWVDLAKQASKDLRYDIIKELRKARQI